MRAVEGVIQFSFILPQRKFTLLLTKILFSELFSDILQLNVRIALDIVKHVEFTTSEFFLPAPCTD